MSCNGQCDYGPVSNRLFSATLSTITEPTQLCFSRSSSDLAPASFWLDSVTLCLTVSAPYRLNNIGTYPWVKTFFMLWALLSSQPSTSLAQALICMLFWEEVIFSFLKVYITLETLLEEIERVCTFFLILLKHGHSHTHGPYWSHQRDRLVHAFVSAFWEATLLILQNRWIP